jgi:hypothetical protein
MDQRDRSLLVLTYIIPSETHCPRGPLSELLSASRGSFHWPSCWSGSDDANVANAASKIHTQTLLPPRTLFSSLTLRCLSPPTVILWTILMHEASVRSTDSTYETNCGPQEKIIHAQSLERGVSSTRAAQESTSRRLLSAHSGLNTGRDPPTLTWLRGCEKETRCWQHAFASWKHKWNHPGHWGSRTSLWRASSSIHAGFRINVAITCWQIWDIQ